MPKFELLPGETLNYEGYLDHWRGGAFHVISCHGRLTNTRFVACKKSKLLIHLGILGAILLMKQRSKTIHFEIPLEQITDLCEKRYGLAGMGRKTIIHAAGNQEYSINFSHNADAWQKALIHAIQLNDPNVLVTMNDSGVLFNRKSEN